MQVAGAGFVFLFNPRRGCAVPARLKASPAVVVMHDQSERRLWLRELRGRDCHLRSGHPSAPKLVRCYHESRLRVNEKCHFGTQATVREWSSQSPDAGASNGCEFHNSLLIHCYSLFFAEGASSTSALSSARIRWREPCCTLPRKAPSKR